MENDVTEATTDKNIDETTDKDTNKILSETSNIEIFKPGTTSLEGPKVIGFINLDKIWDPKKKDKSESYEGRPKESVIDNAKIDMLPSMGKILRMGPMYGWISRNDQDENLYFNTTELISYAGIIDAPRVGDDVIFTIGQKCPWCYGCVHT